MTVVDRGTRQQLLALAGAVACAAGLAVPAVLTSPVAAARSAGPAAPGPHARAGHIDPSFGKRGKVLVPADLPQDSTQGGLEFEMAPSPGGKVVVGLGQTIYRFLPSGRPDRDFGQHGRVAIEVPAGIRFQPAGIAVDRSGQVVLAGTSSHLGAVGDPGPPQYGGPPPTWATVFRYGRDGLPDQGFGTDGRVDTTLGLAPPTPHVDFVDPSKATTYVTPAVSIEAVAVDAEGRPLITGSSVTQISTCYMGDSNYVTRAYLIRLTGDGSYDANLSDGHVAAAKAGAALTSTPDGDLFFQGQNTAACSRGGPDNQPTQILKLTPTGSPDPGFGSGGVATLRPGRGSDLVADRRGRVVLLGHPEVLEAGRETQKFKELITRLRPNGSLDPSFGRNGQRALPLREGGSLDALAVDDRGRLLLAGMAPRPARNPSQEFQLPRMTARGQVDRSFGKRGFVRTRFGASSSAGAEAATVDRRGRILVGGMVRSPRFPTRSGFALVRYLGGR